MRQKERQKEEIVAIATINPATGETVKTYDEMSEADVERCLAAALGRLRDYRLTRFDERAEWMRAGGRHPRRASRTRSRR